MQPHEDYTRDGHNTPAAVQERQRNERDRAALAADWARRRNERDRFRD